MSDARLLAALGGRGWCSGAAVASDLGVSRAAVWKGIERLRRQGYAIEGEAGRGYRMAAAADRLLPAEIRRHWQPRRFSGEIVHREVVDSTNRVAAELARAGAAEGTCVVAERQTAGRGRLGRTWESPPHLNLYLSVILRPPLAPVEVPRVTLVAAVAVAEAIEATTGRKPEIKWPNDVLLDGGKTTGILTELEAEAERVRFAILGIGVNLNGGPEDFPPELRHKATSLARVTGRRVDRAAFAGKLLAALDRAYDELLRRGFAGLKRRYESYHGLVGRRVRVERAEPLTGTVRGIDGDGALLVEGRAGLERVVAGEVSLAESYRRKGPRRPRLALSRRRA